MNHRATIILGIFFSACTGSVVSHTEPLPRRQNSAPSLSGALIPQQDFTRESVITVTPLGWRDADGDPAWYRYQWYINDQPVAGQVLASISGAHFTKGDRVYCQVVPVDFAGEGVPMNSNSVVIVNAAPSLATVSYHIAAYSAADDISLVPLFSQDADGDQVGLLVEWYVNGTAITEATGLTLAKEFYRRGDEVQAKITPYDGETLGESVFTPPITIVNSIPVINSAFLSPGPHHENSIISANAAAEDADDDNLTYVFRWFVNGVSEPSVTGTFITGDNFARGNSVQFAVRVSDGLATTNWAYSSTTVITNAPPNAPSVSIHPSAVSTSDPIWVEISENGDPDGDELTYHYAWFKNGLLQGFPAAQTAVISNTVTYYTEAGDRWSVVVSVNDEFEGTVTASATIEIQKVRWAALEGSVPADVSLRLERSSAVCGIDVKTNLWCWQTSYQRAPWDDNFAITDSTPRRRGSGWASLSENANCGVKIDGSLWCWHPVSKMHELVPERIGNDNDWVSVNDAIGEGFDFEYSESQCALKIDGTLWCWGSNWADILPINTTVTQDNPIIASLTQVTEPATWRAFDISLTHGCGIAGDQSLWCWGHNYFNSIGVAPESLVCTYPTPPPGDCYSKVPALVSSEAWQSIATVYLRTCAVKAEGTLWCWGMDYGEGRLGLGQLSPQTVTYPTQVGSANDWQAVEGHTEHFCALKESGEAYCWGPNFAGRLGLGILEGPSASCGLGPWEFCAHEPIQFPGGPYLQLAPINERICGIKEDRTLWCAGQTPYSDEITTVPTEVLP